jgi:hypothetical protein
MTAPSILPSPGDHVGGRYRIEKLVGSGGMGVVFAGVDEALHRRVAIKLVAPARAGRVGASERLLDEARVMARVEHPAAVRLFDQGADARFGLFLIMELLEGVDLASLLRRRRALPPPLALGVIEQLCGALAEAHEAGVLHHDIKPANVFVLRHRPTQVPRVKLLDFGAAAAVPPRGRGRGSDRELNGRDDARALGTLAYMAPERWAGRRAGVAADIYSLGALLYEMLSGKRPFAAATRAALRLAVMNDPPPPLPAGRGATAPPLVSAITQALDKRPERRPSSVLGFARLLGLQVDLGPTAPRYPAEGDAAEVARALHAGASRNAGAAALLARGAVSKRSFVGRENALALLAEEVARVEKGRPSLVWIEGASGIGKTALLEELRRRLDRRRSVLTFAGRARERESVPFPALDEAMNELAVYLLGLPPALSELLVPRRSSPLGHLFPTLTQVPAVARACAEEDARSEPAEERRLASDGFRELLRRLGDRQPVVLLVDDMQWLDPDSAALLERTFSGPEPPAVLLVGAVRTDEDALPYPELRRLEASLPKEAVSRIRVDALPEVDAREMARARWAGKRPLAERDARRLARLSGGVPFFMEMLVTSPERAALRTARSLEEVLAARRKRLPTVARRMLELVCVSSRPLRLSILRDAFATSRESRVIDPLVEGALVRIARVEGEWAVEPYHARIRESIRRALRPATKRAHHRRLAALLRDGPSGADVEATIEHLAGCGETRAAARLAQRAASAANDQLAFDRAAALYEVVLKHGQPKREQRQSILRQQATALQNAGRRREAGAVLLRAAAGTRDATEGAALRREAGGHLLASGDVTNGLDALMPALEGAGLRLPSNLEEIAAATGAALQRLAERGLVPASASGSPSPEALAKVDLLLDLALGLAHIDLRVLPFACDALTAALDVGEPRRLQRAAALFVINTVEYVATPLVAPTLELCRELTDLSSDPLARALLDAAFAENAHFEGDFLSAEAAFERAERTLLESGATASRELATVRDLAVFVQYAHKGDFRTQLDRTQNWLAQAEAAQDRFHTGMLRVAHAIVWIAHDDTARARADLERAQAESIGTAGVLEVAVALYYDIIDRYEGDEAALAVSGDARSALLRSPSAQTPFLSGYLGLHAAWRALRALGGGYGSLQDGVAAAAVVERLRGLRMGIWSAVADALEGNLEFLRGRRETALGALERAEQTFRRLHMLCLAACARKRRGQFIEGELGARLESEADSELATLGVVDVERWTGAYWSMFDARRAVERTREDGHDGEAAETAASPGARIDEATPIPAPRQDAGAAAATRAPRSASARRRPAVSPLKR